MQHRTHYTAAATLLLCLTAASPADAARKPNFGLYVQNYVMVVSSNADWLVHPTGEYLGGYEKKSWKQQKKEWTPSLRQTENMDEQVLELRDQGYVMIGYSAFGTNEAPESWKDQAMTAEEQLGKRLGLKLRGHDPDADPLGDPIDAARWANAELVVVQRNYAFTRMETQMERIVTDEGDERHETSGDSYGEDESAFVERTDGRSETRGDVRSKGRWKESGWDARGEVEAGKGALGWEGKAGAEGGYYSKKGSDESRTRSKQTTTYGETRSGMQRGSSYNEYGDTQHVRSRHWATALVDEHVDHYDYMVTFWKRADTDKLVLGALTDPLPRDLWSELGTRHARVISAVVGNTPAFDADLWEGDVLLAIEGEAVRGERGYGDLLDRHAGREVRLTVWRQGASFDVPVRLNRR